MSSFDSVGGGFTAINLYLLKVSPHQTNAVFFRLPADWESAFDHSAISPFKSPPTLRSGHASY